MGEIFQIATQISTPLALAGFLAAAAEFDADVLIIGRTSDGESAGRLRDLTYSIVRDSPFAVLSV